MVVSMLNMERIRSLLASLTHISVRSDVLVPRPSVFCPPDLFADPVTMLDNLFLLLGQSLGHLVHVVRVDLGKVS